MDTKFFPCENFEGTFWSHLPPSNLKKEKQELSVKVGCQREPFKAIWRPTSERILPGEIISEWPEIAKALRLWPEFFKKYWDQNLQNISCGLPFGTNIQTGRQIIRVLVSIPSDVVKEFSELVIFLGPSIGRRTDRTVIHVVTAIAVIGQV